MSFNIADYTNINAYSEIAQASGGNDAKSSSKPSFLNVFLNQMPNTKPSFADQARALSEERKIMLNQLLEKLRAESDARRMELLSKLMQNDDVQKPYDIFAKCLDIARRIMRGEKVSAEEMRLLARYFPELLFQALLLKQEDVENDGNDDLSYDDRSGDDSGHGEGNAEIVGASS